MTFLVERNGRELSQIISDKTNKTNKLSATFTDAVNTRVYDPLNTSGHNRTRHTRRHTISTRCCKSIPSASSGKSLSSSDL